MKKMRGILNTLGMLAQTRIASGARPSVVGGDGAHLGSSPFLIEVRLQSEGHSRSSCD